MLPAPPQATSQPGVQLYTLIAIVGVLVVGGGVTTGVIISGHTDPASLALVASVLGSCGTIIVVLLNLLQTTQVSNKVQDVHLSVNSRLDELVGQTAASSFQAGQAAGPGAPVPGLSKPGGPA